MTRRFKFALSILSVLVMLFTVACKQKEVNSENMNTEQFTVTLVPSHHGSYSILPEIPEDGKVASGTELTVTATPSSSYSLDAIYYRIKGGMWGTLDFESFVPEMKITVDKDMSIGATFVENERVENLRVTHDVVYAKPGVKTLKYDVFSPKGAEKLPCVVIVHGGAWSSNNEDIMRALARELARDGKYVVVSMDYRWVNDLDGDEKPNSMHNLIEDVFGAIAHIQEHAAEYGVDPARIAVTGDSAGGHLSAAAGVFCVNIGKGGFGTQEGVYEFMPSYIPAGKPVEQVKEEITRAIKAVAPSYGPFGAEDFQKFISQTDQGYWDAVSPIKHVPQASERLLPHFIVRGSEDKGIPHEMVQPYIEVLQAAGQEVTYIQVEGAGHAFFDWKPDDNTMATFHKFGEPYAAEMQAFFNKVFY